MIYICADDYGICQSASQHIRECKALNKVSTFVNFDPPDLDKLKDVDVSLHLNFVEGKALSDRDKVDLLVDSSGNFKHTFIGLLKLSLLQRKRLEEQICIEAKAQLKHFKSLVGDKELLIDSHQHTHMIPSVFKMILKALDEEKVKVKYLRIPAEPLLPYAKAVSLYFTYSPVNIIKQWLLKLLWLVNKKEYKKYNHPTAYFFGILFSGKMDIKRVNKVFLNYVSLADKKHKDIEILFHPGYVNKEDAVGLPFEKFYLSENRKTEFEALQKFSKEVN